MTQFILSRCEKKTFHLSSTWLEVAPGLPTSEGGQLKLVNRFRTEDRLTTCYPLQPDHTLLLAARHAGQVSHIPHFRCVSLLHLAAKGLSYVYIITTITSMFTLRSSDVTIFSLARKSMVMTHISSIVWLEFTNNLGGDDAAIWRERH